MQLEVECETSQAIHISSSNHLDYSWSPEILTEKIQLYLDSFAHEIECKRGSLAVCQDCPLKFNSHAESEDFCNTENTLYSQEHGEKIIQSPTGGKKKKKKSKKAISERKEAFTEVDSIYGN